MIKRYFEVDVIEFIEQAKLPTRWGLFDIHGFWDDAAKKEHIALTMGDLSQQPILTRVHSECLTGDALFSLRCDCGPQLEGAMKKIAEEGAGVILYLRQEGRGIGLLNKIKAYNLQDQGADTVEANTQLGFGADMREYGVCKSMLAHLKVEKIKLLTNNPKKLEALRQQGIDVVERVEHYLGENPHNSEYLSTKVEKMGHFFNEKK